MSCHFGLSLASEDPLPVAKDPVELLLCHEVSKIPDHFADEVAVGHGRVKGAEVGRHQLGLVLLGEDERRVLELEHY